MVNLADFKLGCFAPPWRPLLDRLPVLVAQIDGLVRVKILQGIVRILLSILLCPARVLALFQLYDLHSFHRLIGVLIFLVQACEHRQGRVTKIRTKVILVILCQVLMKIITAVCAVVAELTRIDDFTFVFLSQEDVLANIFMSVTCV